MVTVLVDQAGVAVAKVHVVSLFKKNSSKSRFTQNSPCLITAKRHVSLRVQILKADTYYLANHIIQRFHFGNRLIHFALYHRLGENDHRH